VHFLGRVDSQLKVRGHRVEIQPVEDMLQTQFSEIEAAVLDYQNEELVAFVAAPSISRDEVSAVAPAPSKWAARVTERLARQLPAPSVPTRIFLVDEFVMKPMSGKIDRERLPSLSNLLSNGEFPAGGNIAGPVIGTQYEEPGAEAPSPDLHAPTGLGWDDAFADHGGHSIVIARLAQRLRSAGWTVTVRDLLSHCNTARKVADRPQEDLRASGSAPAAPQFDRDRIERDEAVAGVLSVGWFTTLQVLFLLLLYSPSVAGLVGLVAIAEIGEFFVTARLSNFIFVGAVMYLAALSVPFATLLWVMVIKLFMGGHISRNNLTPGVYPKWSRMHLRTWYVERMELSVLRSLRMMLRSAPLMAWVLRRLGATVGDNLHCAHDAELSGPLDLLTIGDDVAIQTGAFISTCRWLGQELHVGPIHLESGCKIGMRAGVANDVTVGSGSWITPLTPILDDVGPEQMWEGAPARCTGRCATLNRSASHCRSSVPSWFRETLNILMQVVLELCLLVLPTAIVTWLAVSIIPTGESERVAEYFKLTPLHEIVWQMGLFAFVTTWVTIVLISILGCVFLRCTPASPGLYPSRGLKAALLLYRVKKLNQIQRLWTWTITGQYLRALAGLRLTRTGASECDFMFNLVPELVSADSQVFWSHGCFTNVLDYGAEHLKLGQLDMPANFFASNNCVAEAGQLPTSFLLGVSTPGNDIRFRRQMRSRLGEPITVAGNPPLKFGSADFEAENRAQEMPSFALFLARFSLNDFFSIGLLPIAEVLVYAVLYTILLRAGGHPVVSGLVALILVEGVLIASSFLVKKILVGRWGTDHSTSFWSWRHFTYFFAQDCFFAWCKRPLRFLAGTVLSNLVLRRMGCRIGKRTVFAAPLQAFDWNAVSFGDDCVIEGLLQFHTFENMMLKVKRAHIRNGSSINFGATVMGGAVLEPDTTLSPLSMVLKEMHLPTAIYEGSPTEAVSGAPSLFPGIMQPRPGAAHPGLFDTAAGDKEPVSGSRGTR
jgi:non-ribosomal peptide synthetase-like protein